MISRYLNGYFFLFITLNVINSALHPSCLHPPNCPDNNGNDVRIRYSDAVTRKEISSYSGQDSFLRTHKYTKVYCIEKDTTMLTYHGSAVIYFPHDLTSATYVLSNKIYSDTIRLTYNLEPEYFGGKCGMQTIVKDVKVVYTNLDDYELVPYDPGFGEWVFRVYR